MRNHENLPIHRWHYLFYLISQHNHPSSCFFLPHLHSVLLEEMDLFPKHLKTPPCKQTDLESYTQQMWHTWWPRSPQQVHPHLPQQRRSESPRGLHLWSAARCCRGRAPRWTAHSPPRCGLPPSASRTDLLGSHLSHARSCGESLQSQNRPISFFGTQLIFLWDEHWADPDLPQSSQRPFLLRMLALQWKNLQTTKEASPIRASAKQGGAVQPFCGAVIPALLTPACFFEGSGRWGTRCTCQDYQLAFQNQASKAETRCQQPPKIKKTIKDSFNEPVQKLLWRNRHWCLLAFTMSLNFNYTSLNRLLLKYYINLRANCEEKSTAGLQTQLLIACFRISQLHNNTVGSH